MGICPLIKTFGDFVYISVFKGLYVPKDTTER